MNCPTCGKYLSKGDTYCTFCKKEVVIEPEMPAPTTDENIPVAPQPPIENAPPENAPLPAEVTPLITASLVDEPSRPESPPLPATGPRKETFETVYRSEAFQNRQSTARLASVPRVPQWQVALTKGLPVIILIFMLPVLVVPLLMFLFMFLAGEVKFILCPLVFFLLLLTMIISIFLAAKKSTLHSSKKKAGSQGPSIESFAAIIVGRRTTVWGEHHHQQYHLTAEFANGDRREYKALSGELAGKIVDGDAGVIFTQGTYLCDFDRVVL